jgi:hypothetical protein
MERSETTIPLLEVTLEKPDDFLKVAETLTRVGIISSDKTKLYQSAHILHKKGKYYIVSFKEMFVLDGKESNITAEDISRRNKIAKLLETWKLLKIVEGQDTNETTDARYTVIPFKDKRNVELIPKYSIGKKF